MHAFLPMIRGPWWTSSAVLKMTLTPRKRSHSSQFSPLCPNISIQPLSRYFTTFTGRDGCCSHGWGKEIIWLGWHLRALTRVRVLPSPADPTVSKWQFCYLVKRFPVTRLQGQLRTSCLPTLLPHILILWAPRVWRTCSPEQGLLTEPRCGVASTWNRAKKGQQTCDQSKLAKCPIPSI